MSIHLRPIVPTEHYRSDPDGRRFMDEFATLLAEDRQLLCQNPERDGGEEYARQVHSLARSACFLIEHEQENPPDGSVTPEVIGAATFDCFTKGIVELGTLSINESFRNRGFGAKALQGLRRIAANSGYETMELFSLAKAEPFYRREGFTTVPNSYSTRTLHYDLTNEHDA